MVVDLQRALWWKLYLVIACMKVNFSQIQFGMQTSKVHFSSPFDSYIHTYH